jgi:cytochrome c oxidase assembly protein subunit 15
MSGVDLYNLDPALQLLGVGLVLGGLPVWWLWRRHRLSSGPRRLKALTLMTLFITFDLVLFGAFTRLTDSGLGCPDWPGCYGSASPIGAREEITAAQTAMPTGPVTHSKAWIEMVHRYMASGVGMMILVLAILTWRQRIRQPKDAVHPGWPLLTLLWVCVQGAFGALTVTMKLFPAIVTLHLLFGLGLLALLTAQAVRYEGWGESPLDGASRAGLWIAYGLLWMQIALGGWVSTNYAVLACPDFPTCNGQWWPQANWQGFGLWRELGRTVDGNNLPFAALVTIHHIHRSMAWLVLAVLLLLGWRLLKMQTMMRLGRWLLGLCALQFCTGLSNVVLDWPLLAAVLHTAGAAGLVTVLTWALAASHSGSRALLSATPSSHRVHRFVP